MPTALEQSIHKHFLEKDLFFDTKFDLVLKWFPFVSVYVLGLFGFKTRSSWRKQIVVTAATVTTRYFIADRMKKITDERRPMPYFNHHSFPSGDTSSAFAGAEFMHRELKDSYRLLSYGGYAAAAGVGFIRLMKNKHWLKDVVAGAIVGVCVTKLVYAVVERIQEKAERNPLEIQPSHQVEKENEKASSLP